MVYLKYLEENSKPIGYGEKSDESPVHYLDILREQNKPRLFVLCIYVVLRY